MLSSSPTACSSVKTSNPAGRSALAAAWQPYNKPGNWPDLDMLPLGELRPSPGWGSERKSRLTPDEQRTMLTLWAINRSPLILGANLTLLDEATLKLLTNRDLLRVDQDAGHRGKPLRALEGSALHVWSSALGISGKVTALFNVGDTPLAVDRLFGELELVGAGGQTATRVREVWSGQTLGKSQRLQMTIPAHGCLLLIAE